MDLIAYSAMFAVCIYSWYIEKKDIQCPNFQASFDQCKQHGGMAFSYTNPDDSDTCQTLISKISKALSAEQATIKWRRAFTLSVLVMVLAFVLVITPGTLPDWKVFYLSVLICFCIIFGNLNYYSYHVFGRAEEWGKINLEKLKECVR